eukprot:2355862-Prymnesium_polylepis.2
MVVVRLHPRQRLPQHGHVPRAHRREREQIVVSLVAKYQTVADDHARGIARIQHRDALGFAYNTAVAIIGNLHGEVGARLRRDSAQPESECCASRLRSVADEPMLRRRRRGRC